MAGTSFDGPSLDLSENFPGWEKASVFLQQLIVQDGLRKVADIGGGATPLLSQEFTREQQIDYTLLDISQAELDKAPAYYNKVQVDLTAPTSRFVEKMGNRRFDLVFSHMFLEHVQDPLAVHRNIDAVLRPGGLAVHINPTANNLPLTINRLLPEKMTRRLLSIIQPHRHQSGTAAKFPAYYALCGPPNKEMHEQFEKLGFDVLRHTGYIGHDYYRRIPVIGEIERALRPVLLKARIPLTMYSLLVLQKPPWTAGQPQPA